jgi:hypothetical protein
MSTRVAAATLVSLIAATALSACAERSPTRPAGTSLQAKIGPFQRSHAPGRRHAKAQKAGNQLGMASIAAATPSTLDQLLGAGEAPLENNGLCPPDMASVDDLFCVDRYEASLVEILPNGDERPYSPYATLETPQPTDPRPVVRAVSEPNVVPQAYVSADQASQACARSGKRLCKRDEWRKACKGPEKTTYGYGNQNEPGRCNDHGRAPMSVVFGIGGGSNASEWGAKMNDPQLNQVEGTVAETGSHEGCTNGYGVYDMVGNLHEWVADAAGTFRGGYYMDTAKNGDGCDYATVAHGVGYHDYSTGFRCCADASP